MNIPEVEPKSPQPEQPHPQQSEPEDPVRDLKVASRAKPRKDRSHWLYIAVIAAVVGGVLVGGLGGESVAGLSVLGTMFVNLIKMIIVPVIFCTIVLGIGSVRAAATVGRAGGLALLYFVTMSTFALFIGLVVGNFVHAGDALVVDTTYTPTDTAEAGEGGVVGFIQSLIPTTLFSPLVGSSVLQTLALALLVGFAVQALGKQGEPILRAIGYLQKLVFKILSWILWLAPIGAFGAMAGVVGKTGWSAVGQLALLMVAFYATCLIFVFGVLGLVLKAVTGLNVFRLFRYLGREFLLILATSSSESALPNLMRKMEHLGVSQSTVGIVVPTGYSFNLDGTAIYLTMASIFISDAMHVPMSFGEQAGLLAFMIIASKGAAGVSGAGIATLAAGLQTYRPELLDGVGLIVGIDRFMSEARALTNFAGNSIATLVVGKWTRTVDFARVRAVLSGELPFVQSDVDDEVDLRLPDVENPAQDRLLPTPQVDLTRYPAH
ncbi:cation:dicarboxylate symporter family transporter [Schaalia naturae]|uniref:Cation:dicarboxylate symporter family transporter n=1 Tax=Schaalia naturae TaxID=635203 RepID=A0ABW2SP80_9ACTO